MMKIGQLIRRSALFTANRQLTSETLNCFQTLFQPKCVQDITVFRLQPSFVPVQSIIKLYKSTEAKEGRSDEKRTTRRFTPEDDKKIIKHVGSHGTSKKSLSKIAKELKRPIISIDGRCRKLLSANEYETNMNQKDWDFAEDKKLFNYVFNLKKINAKNISSLGDVKVKEFEEMAKALKRSSNSLYDHWKKTIIPYLEPHMEDLASSKMLRKSILQIVEKRFEKITYHRGYSEKDITFIIEQVKLKGDVPQTWIDIAKELGKKRPRSVEKYFHDHIAQTPKIKGRFSPQEDEMILKFIEKNGKTQKSFTDLAKNLGRASGTSVQRRHDRLISSNKFDTNAKRKTWDFNDDKSLIDLVLKMKKFKPKDSSILEAVKETEFIPMGNKLKRSSNSCYERWIRHIVPILKTYLKKLPLNNEWKRDVLSHIVKIQIKDMKETDIDLILKEIAPGQTSRSIIMYLHTLRMERVNGVMKSSKLPLCDLASKRLREQYPSDSLFNENHKGEQKRLEWCQDVISYYKTLI